MKQATVKIICKSIHGGWIAVNLSTDRRIHLKSARRLRCRMYTTTERVTNG